MSHNWIKVGIEQMRIFFLLSSNSWGAQGSKKKSQTEHVKCYIWGSKNTITHICWASIINIHVYDPVFQSENNGACWTQLKQSIFHINVSAFLLFFYCLEYLSVYMFKQQLQFSRESWGLFCDLQALCPNRCLQLIVAMDSLTLK